MRKRILCLLLCLAMTLAIPCNIVSAGGETGKNYIDSGRLSFGTATLYAQDGTSLQVDFVYSAKITVTEQNAAKLADALGRTGLLPQELPISGRLVAGEGLFIAYVSDSDAVELMVAAMDKVSDSDVLFDNDTSSGMQEASGSDVSDTDVSDSDAHTASGSDVTSESDAVSAADLHTVSVADASDTDSEDEETESTVQEKDSDFVIPSEESREAYSIEQLAGGAVEFDALSTLKASFAAAFPEFGFDQPRAVNLSDNIVSGSNIEMADDRLSAAISIDVEPEVVERVIYGQTYTLLMVSNDSYRYTVEVCDLSGRISGAVIPQETPTVVTSTVTTTATTTFSILEQTTTTTTASTTAATTTATTTAAATTTTAAPTTVTAATTAATTVNNAQSFGTGYVCTRYKNLRVRTGPGLGYSIITYISKGTRVEVLSLTGNWYHVRLQDGTEGYCYSRYIALD